MDNSRRKLPSWMLGVKKNENNNFEISNNNGCQNEEDNGKLVKACRKAKRVSVKKRKNDGDDDEVEVELCDEPRGRDGGKNRRIKKNVNDDSCCVEGDNGGREGERNDGDGDEFEVEVSDESRGRVGGNRRMKREVNVDKGDNGSREGEKKDLGMRHKMKGNVVDDMVDDEIGYGKRKNSVKERKEKLRSNLVDSDDYEYVDGDKEMIGERRSKRGRKWKSKGKSDELEEDEAEDDDDGGGAQGVMRKCKGKRRATSASISDGADDLTVEDLVSIAEEYVNKDMEAAQQHSLSQGVSNDGNLMTIRKEHPNENEEICGNNPFGTFIHDNTQSGGSSNSKLLSSEEAGSHGLMNENVTVMKPIMTGNPTQDMLDLFLGHLLKKPQQEEEEKKLDNSLAAQRREPVAAPVDAVPFTKKKSSLKDKVAMFFD